MDVVKPRCACGVKLFVKFIDIGLCAECQGKNKSYEYYKENIRIHDEKHGITKEERAKINRERTYKSRQKKKNIELESNTNVCIA